MPELVLPVASCQNHPAINCSFFLFQHFETVVEINLVGAVLPIIFSAFLVVFFRKRFHWLRVGAFTLVSFAVITGIDSAYGAVYGGLATPGWVFVLFWLFIVTLYSKLRVVKEEVLLGMGELYVIGTLGVLSDDVVRTLLGFLNVPIVGLKITPNIWGGRWSK